MATHTTRLTLTHTDDQVPALSVFKNNPDRAFAETADWLEALAAGQNRGTLTMTRDNGDAVAASGAVTLSGASGTVGATINGVSITVAYATSDTVTAAALAAAINASVNALVQPFVTAIAAAGVVTVTAKTPGVAGNTITLAASGTGATANANRLTLGADATTAGLYTLDR
jgi:phage tail sheath gpL-like